MSRQKVDDIRPIDLRVMPYRKEQQLVFMQTDIRQAWQGTI